jgi:hypothetical protein
MLVACLLMAGTALMAGTVLSACGAGTITQRQVDTQPTTVHEYGAPQQTEYSLELEPAKENLGITVYEHSTCDRIKVDVVHRTRETLEGDRVINRTPLGKVQIAQKIEGSVPCAQRFAREARVSLKVGDAVYAIGTTNAEGRVGVDLAKKLDTDVYGVPPEGEVVVLVRGQGAMEQREVMRLPLSELKTREDRVAQLSQQLGELLAKDPAQMSSSEVTAAYQLYAQLRKIAWYDSRFEGLALRFWEVWQNRRSLEAAENLGRNLEALKKAQGVLQTASLATIPLFAQVAVNAGSVSPRVLEWARWEMLDGFRQHPEICNAGFGWSGIPTYPFSPQARVAAHYLNYAYGDPYAEVLSGMCPRVRGLR